MVVESLSTLRAADQAFIAADTLEQLPLPALLGQTRAGGIDLNKPPMRLLLAAVLSSAPAPQGFRVAAVAAQALALRGTTGPPYTARHAAYDLTTRTTR